MVFLPKIWGAAVDNFSRLQVEIKNTAPVELSDFAQCLQAFAAEYNRFTHINPESSSDDTPGEVKLFVKEIRPGSIVAEVMAMAPGAMFAMANANTVIQFGGYIAALLAWYIGKGGDKPCPVEKSTLLSLSSIVEPVAKDGGAILNLGTINNTGTLVLNISMDSRDANAAQNNIKRELEMIKEPVTGIHEKVLLYWAQAKNQIKNKRGDKARIESIHHGDVKVIFDDDNIKGTMLYGDGNPFKKAYVVDVVVETVGGRPALYKVVRLHEAFDL